MSAPLAARHANCTVVGAEKLPADIGGPHALCSAIQRAVAAQAPGVRFTAVVKVISDSRLSAVVLVNGSALPEQNFAVMDGKLSQNAIGRFAETIATKIAKAAKQ